jgi:hypothetical protein
MWLGMRQSGAWQQHEEGRDLVAPALLYALIHPSAWKGHSANFGCPAMQRAGPSAPPSTKRGD